MGSTGVFACMIKPVRKWAPPELDAPGRWESECIALRSSLRDTMSEVNRLGLVVAEKDAVIAGLKKYYDEG